MYGELGNFGGLFSAGMFLILVCVYNFRAFLN
jgi:hypothetical protein